MKTQRVLIKLEPLNFTEHPDLRKLQSLGAGPSILRECQDGFRKFKNECFIDDLTKAYSIMIKAEGSTSGHLTLFNHIVGFLKNDDRFDLFLLVEEFSEEIKIGKSSSEMWKEIFTTEAGNYPRD